MPDRTIRGLQPADETRKMGRPGGSPLGCASTGRQGSSRKGKWADLMDERAGQSLLETALMLPVLIVLLLNAVNIGYMFCVYLNLSTAPRQGAMYSIQGTSTALEVTLPSADAVSSLVYDNLGQTLPSGGSTTPMRVCSLTLGLNGTGSTQLPNCTTYGSGTGSFSTQQPDPEAPYMVLQSVDVQYSVNSLFQGSPFNLLSGPLTLHKTVMMRAMP